MDRSQKEQAVKDFKSIFDEADLRGSNFTNALLMQSSFIDVRIDGADFSNAILDTVQKNMLCSLAEGVNPISGIETGESLGC